MNVGLKLSRLFSNRWIFFLQPFPYRRRILFVRSSHRFLRGQTPGSQIASHRPHRNLQIELSGQQLLHRVPGTQRNGLAQLIRASAENVAHRGGCLMRCQSRNRRSSSTLGFQRPASYPFHHPHPAVHRTSSYSEISSRLSLRKTLLSCLNDSPAKVFLSFRRQRASILVSHADTLAHYFWPVIYIMLRLVCIVILRTERIYSCFYWCTRPQGPASFGRGIPLNYAKAFGRRLKSVREAAGLTQE